MVRSSPVLISNFGAHLTSSVNLFVSATSIGGSFAGEGRVPILIKFLRPILSPMVFITSLRATPSPDPIFTIPVISFSRIDTNPEATSSTKRRSRF